jgi:hypothetical protein
MSLRTRFNIGSRRWPFAVPVAVALTLAGGTIASASSVFTTLASAPTPREALGAAGAPCPGGTIAGGCIYAEGGENAANTVLNTNQIFNTFNNTWSTGTPMPTARGELGVAAARCLAGTPGTCIYALDGHNGAVLNTNEAYRPNTSTWSTLTPDNVARKNLGAAAAPCPGGTIAAGCVYGIGGYDGTNYLATNEAFSTFNNTWITLTAMPTAREELAVVSARCPFGSSLTCVYALGGYDGSTALSKVEVFSPKLNTWTTVASMPTARAALGAASAPCPGGTIPGGCVYAIGGDDESGTILNKVEVYSTFNNTWSTLTPDPKAREALAVAAGRCGSTCIYAIDGGDDSVVFDTTEALHP